MVCPFGAIHASGTSIAGVAGHADYTPTFPKGTDPLIQWQIGVYTRAVKCDLCDFDPKGPACVRACPTHALVYVHSGDMMRRVVDRRTRAAQQNAVVAPMLKDSDAAGDTQHAADEHHTADDEGRSKE